VRFLTLLSVPAAEPFSQGKRQSTVPSHLDLAYPDSSLATGSDEHQSPVQWSDPLLTSASSSVISLDSHGSGSGRNFEAEWLRILLDASQEVVHLQQRQFEEEKMLMKRHFDERQEKLRAQFNAERMLYESHRK
jgi:hypothetical protein